MSMDTSKCRTINIHPDICDPFYRYKMPIADCACEGRGGNRNTKIFNLDKIARSLARPSSHIAKWLRLYFKTSVCKLDNGDNHRDYSQNNNTASVYKLNGHITPACIQTAIYALITEWVLCKTCSNPETFLLRSVGGTKIKICCQACGAVTRIRKSTYNGNLPYFNFLLQECPESSQDSVGSSASGGDIAARDTMGLVASDGGPYSPRPDMPIVLSRSNSREPEQDTDDTEWSVDVSPEAVAARQAEVSRNIALADVIGNCAAMTPDLTTCAITMPNNMPNDMISAILANPHNTKATPSTLNKRLLADKLCDLLDYTRAYWPITPHDFRIKHIALSIDEKRACMVLPYLWQGDQLKKDINKYMCLMEYMLVGKVDNQYYFLRELSRYLEILMIGNTDNTESTPITESIITADGICGLLAHLYEEDLIDDESYKRWYTRGIGKHTRSSEFAKQLKEYIVPFNEWLSQSEDEDNEDDDNVGENDNNRHTGYSSDIINSDMINSDMVMCSADEDSDVAIDTI